MPQITTSTDFDTVEDGVLVRVFGMVSKKNRKQLFILYYLILWYVILCKFLKEPWAVCYRIRPLDDMAASFGAYNSILA